MITLNRRRVMGGESLPYDAEVQWLAKDTSYFNTNIAANGNIVIRVWLQDYFNTSHYGKWAFGGRRAYNNNAFGMFIASDTHKVIFAYNGGSLALDTYSSYPESCWVEIGNGIIKIGNTTHTYTKKTFNDVYNVWLFGLNNGGSLIGSDIKIGEVEMSSGNNSLHIIPVRVGAVGYYYNVDSGELSTNTYIAGPDKT